MPLPLQQLIHRYRLRVDGLIHLGAHLGEEARLYARLGIAPVWWIEGNPELLDGLRANVEPYGGVALAALLAETDDEDVAFHVTNNGQSSSILGLGTHAEHHPEIVVTRTERLRTRTLDALAREHGLAPANFLVVDLQGAELRALRGAEDTLRRIDQLVVEVNEEELYDGCALIGEVDEHLSDRGFSRVETVMTPHRYGEALYVRRPVTPPRRPSRRIELETRARNAVGRVIDAVRS